MHRDLLARSRAARRCLTVAALAAALASPAAANAAPRTTPATSGPSLAAPAPAPSEVPLPPPPAGTSLRPLRIGWLGLSAGPWAGFGGGSGAAVQVDYGYLRTPPGWSRLQLEVRLAATIARPTDSTALTTVVPTPYGPPVQISSGTDKMSAWVFEVVPTARALYPVGPKFSVFGDVGLGLVQTLEKHERDEMFVGRTDTTKNVTGLVLRLGAGMSFELSERTRLLFVPLALSLQAGTGLSAYAPALGLAYRL